LGRVDAERRRSFYENLASASGGNVRDALALWINAVTHVDGDVVNLSNIIEPSMAWFDQLGRDAHRVAAAVTVCGTLSAAEGVDVMHWPSARVDAALAALHGAHVIVLCGEDRYQLWPPASRRVTALLEERRRLIPMEESP
jgi:hypothetical protein